MREELRRKLPKTWGWGTGITMAIIVIILILVYLVWYYVLMDTPAKVVNQAINAARKGDTAALRASLTPESLQNPTCDHWISQLQKALARDGVGISDTDIVGDEATVKVSVPHLSTTGQMTRTEVGIKTLRTEKDWQIDLEATIASTGPQFWRAVAEQG